MAAVHYNYGLGRRKSATARVRLVPGKGNIVINGKSAADYFENSKNLLAELQKPFVALEMVDKYDLSVVVKGGGHAGQVDAIKLGTAKALSVMNEDLRNTICPDDILIEIIQVRTYLN